MANKKTSIGGQALIEGIMMRGPETTAMAVRNASGKIILEKSATKTNIPKILKLPIIRGVYGMISSFTTGYKYLMRSADISLADAEQELKKDSDAKNAGGTDAISVSESPVSEPELADKPVSEPELAGENARDTQSAEPTKTASDTVATPENTLNSIEKNDNTPTTSENKLLLTITMVIGVVLGVGLMIFLFILIPSFVAKFFIPGEQTSLTGTQSILRSAIESIIKISLLVLYMWLVSFMKDIKRTFMYHGAEHKTIFCYEKGLPLTVENVRKQKRFHPRCGTSFLILMLLVGFFIGLFIRFENVFLRSLLKLALLPITVGIGYELIKFAGRHDNILTKIISAPGVWLQHITTREPDDGMIECAIAAMNEVIPEDSEKDNW